MAWKDKEVIRTHFSSCLGRATVLIDITSRQTSTNPTYLELQDIMDLRSGLRDESLGVEEELNYFLNYDELFTGQPGFYIEISDLGRALEEAVDRALVMSRKFLRCLTDVDGVFQSSKITCLKLATGIMSLVDRGVGCEIHYTIGDLEDMREMLRRKFVRLKGSWENLLQSAL